jgi:hypothetical protein
LIVGQWEGSVPEHDLVIDLQPALLGCSFFFSFALSFEPGSLFLGVLFVDKTDPTFVRLELASECFQDECL